jgi:uncharacterized protein
MNQPDYERASSYAFDRLERELPAMLTYHNVGHTRDDVMRAVKRFAALEAIPPDMLLLLYTAVCFHDIGYVQQIREHERISMEIAEEVLPSFGYSMIDIRIINRMIMATRLPQRPQTLLEQLLADADLDVLGNPDFPRKNAALREELAALNERSTDVDWYTAQLTFLQRHNYFTAAARQSNDAQKARNVVWLTEQLTAAREKDSNLP